MEGTGNNSPDTNEMMKAILLQLSAMKDDIALLKNDRLSTSKDLANQQPSVIPSVPLVSPRPAVLPEIEDFDEGQYAAENCLPNLGNPDKAQELADQIEKLTRDMETMKCQGPKNLDMSEFMIAPGVVLPPKFKMPDFDKYDGMGCPRSHLKSVIPLLQQHGLSPEQIALVFPRTLTGTAKKWFLHLKPEESRTLEGVANKFVQQFSMEEGIDVTKRDLKSLKQGPNETFTSFIRRWRRKAAQMTHKLPDDNLIKIAVKNLSPFYFPHMSIQYFNDFDHLIKTGTRIEDILAKGGLRARTSTSDVREGKRPMAPPKEVNNVNTARPVRREGPGGVRPERTEPRQFTPLPYSLSVALKKLLRDKKITLLEPREAPNPLPKYWRRDQYCEFHQSVGHLTDRCMALRHRIQDKIEAKEIAVEALPNVTRNPLPTHTMPPPNVFAILTEEVVLDHSRICAVISDEPYILRWESDDEEVKREEPYVLSSAQEVGESSEGPYVLRFEGEEEKSEVPYVLKLEDEDLLLLNDPCDEVRHVTRGGRFFKPPELRAENPAEIARAVENQNQRLSPEEDEDILLKQLRKTQANVSIWGLLMSSPKHRQVILRELNTAQVSVDITPGELVGLVSMARSAMTVSFSDEDLTPEGKNHTKSLRITVVCNKKKVPEVLVDNGSALNVCPLSTATALGFGPNDYVPSEQGILAYDGTRRDVIGTLVTEIEIGGEMFDIEFQVLDIKTSFFLLLGRPWLHKVGVVPSTVHQKLKFIKDNRIVTVRGDPEPEVGQISQEQIGSSTIDVSLTGFSLEVSTITMEEAMSEEILFMSSANAQVARIMRKYGYIPGTGLGRSLQGLTEWPELKVANNLFGLGYEPTKKEIRERKQYMLKWAELRRRGLELPMGPFSLLMNGKYRKEGADRPFYGFPEPWFDESGKELPGFEIFSADELPDEYFHGQIVAVEKQESDWAKNLEPQLLDSLFEVEAPVIAMIGEDARFLNPKGRITPAEVP
ncbi:uncharacterized protein LOC143887087 isoform X2 [Tasmannia lanceolata]